MGPKKKGGRSNKKKQKDQSSVSSSQPSNSQKQKQQQAYIDNLPTFHSENTNHPPNANDKGGIYERYKECTHNFRDWMQQVLPSHKIDTVNDLNKGVDQIWNQAKGFIPSAEDSSPNVVIAPLEIMENLTTSTRYRERMADTKYGSQGDDADVGHKYMIKTLKYCKQILRLSQKVVRVAIQDARLKNEQDEEELCCKDKFGGRFDALILDDSDEKGDDQFVVDDEMIRQRQFPHIAAPVEPATPYNIEDLINGDNRFQALAFLRIMEEHMALVDLHYGLLKETLCGQELHYTGSPFWLKLLMECAAVANMATETVLVMETSLAVNHPHFCRLFLAFLRLYSSTQS